MVKSVFEAEEVELRDALGLIEITGLAPALVALDVLDKAADVRLVQAELNDQLGALIKIVGAPAAVRAAVDAAEGAARAMRVNVVSSVINAPDAGAWRPGLQVVPDVRTGLGALGGIYTAVVEAPAPVAASTTARFPRWSPSRIPSAWASPTASWKTWNPSRTMSRWMRS